MRDLATINSMIKDENEGHAKRLKFLLKLKEVALNGKPEKVKTTREEFLAKVKSDFQKKHFKVRS